MNNEVIKLVTVLGETTDESGFKTGERVKEVEVFASTKSVGRTEFYEALRSGYTVSIIFAADKDDFELSVAEIETEDGKKKKVKASKIIYNDTNYLIRRTYTKTEKNEIEITCEEVE